jgi:UDP-glucose 4-epimerase
MVTGGAGFLGSCLVERLLSAGFEVDALDDLSQGRMDNLRQALKIPRFRFHLGSVLDTGKVESLVETADLVFHLAAVVGMPNVIRAGAETLMVNAGGSYAVLRSCARYHRRCVVFSSSEVYGNGAKDPFEERQALRPGRKGTARWYYAMAKICSERAALHHHADSDLPVTVVRPFNAVGARQSEAAGMVLPTFVHCALEGENLPVYGTGAQRRTFVAAEDLIDQVIALALDEAAHGLVVNVGGDEEYSVEELASMVIDVLDSSSAICKVDYGELYDGRYTDIVRRRPDLGRLDKLGHLRRLKPIRQVVKEMAGVFKKRGR